MMSLILYMKENGLMILKMEKVYKYGLMVSDMMVIGKKEKIMGMAVL